MLRIYNIYKSILNEEKILMYLVVIADFWKYDKNPS